jgi:hypothetical protein
MVETLDSCIWCSEMVRLGFINELLVTNYHLRFAILPVYLRCASCVVHPRCAESFCLYLALSLANVIVVVTVPVSL